MRGDYFVLERVPGERLGIVEADQMEMMESTGRDLHANIIVHLGTWQFTGEMYLVDKGLRMEKWTVI